MAEENKADAKKPEAKKPEGWVDNCLAKIDFSKVENEDTKAQLEEIRDRRKAGDRKITAAEVNVVHKVAVAQGVRK